MDNLQRLQDDEYSFPYHYVSEFRNGFTQNFFDSWGINYVSTIEFILDKLRTDSFRSLVDIGCGDGRLTLEIQRSFPEKKIAGIDYSERAIRLAKAMNPSGDYRATNILTDRVEQAFDAGVLMEVFEHIPPEMGREFVSAIGRLITEKGILYVTVPHANKAVEYKHYRHFTSKLLIECFSEFFEPVEIVPFEKGKTRKRIIDQILGNRFFILNSPRLRKTIYSWYKKNLFISNEAKCNRILIKFRKK